MQKYFIVLFIFLSFVTQTLMEPGTNAIFSRLTPGDLFGILALLFGFKAIYYSLIHFSNYIAFYKASFFMLLCFLAPIFFSFDLQATLVECMILIFLILLSLCVFYYFRDNLLDKLFPLIMYTSIVAAVIGVYDYLAPLVGLPSIFPARAGGEILSGFRNAGQAGAYFLVIVSILYPLRFSSLYKLLNSRHRKLLNISIVIALIFLALTGKIAAYIGIFVGLLGYAIMNRNFKTVFSMSLLSFAGVILFANLQDIAPNVHKRISYKYETRVDNRINGNIDNESDFIQTNIKNAITSFENRPLVGTGLGAFTVNYGEHEVHSTYFKMLGETGVIGTLGYIVFIFAFFRLFKYRKFAKENPYADYLKTILPFIIGCMVSWGYTFHLRKREFWILVAVLLIVNYSLKKYKNQNSLSN